MICLPSKQGRGIMSFMISLAMILTMIPFSTITAEAATEHTCDLAFGSITITPYTSGTPGTLTYYATSGAAAATSETLAEGDSVTIMQTNYESASTANTITVSGSGTADITLAGIKISSGNTPFAIPSTSDAQASVNLKLINGNTLTASGYNCAGLYVSKYSTLHILKESTGSLAAKAGAGHAAGIGGQGDYNAGTGGREACNGTIAISGGTVSAIGVRGSGIGSSEGAWAGSITIDGGSVTALGGAYSAGIGTGWEGSAYNITITGSAVVTASGGAEAAGIGSGRGDQDAASTGAINIGGTADVTAYGGSSSSSYYGAAAIGGGSGRVGGTIMFVVE